MNELTLRRYIKEALVLDAGAAGTASLDIPDGIKNINIMDIVTEEITKGDPTGKRMQQILAFNEMVYNIAMEGGNKNAWQAIAEKMLVYWGYKVDDQAGDKAATAGVTVFYDAEGPSKLGYTYYSVKSSFKSGANSYRAATSSSNVKIQSVCALIIKEPEKNVLGNIGCFCNKKNPVIGWGQVTVPISRVAVIKNILSIISSDNDLAKRFIDATENKPSSSIADKIISDIKNYFAEAGLTPADGRMGLSPMAMVLGDVDEKEIGSLTLVEPIELFEKTLGSGIKDLILLKKSDLS